MEVNEITPENMQLFIDSVEPAYELFEEQFGAEMIELARSYNK